MPLVSVQLVPLGMTLVLEQGTPLQDVLFTHGVEFPCGGRGRCKGCRIKVLSGSLPVSGEEEAILAPGEIATGWRLGCRARASAGLKLELAQWGAPILTDQSKFAFTPREGLGAAVDLGTTTVVAQLLNLSSGAVLAVRTGFNAQARHGADIMSRIEFAVAGGQKTLQSLIRDQIGGMLAEMLQDHGQRGALPLEVVLVGNTVMHHLFCGIAVEPLSVYPFESGHNGFQTFDAADLGWAFAGRAHFLPCLGGFVGSDLLAGILATRLHESESLSALIDLGTNGEIVVGDRRGLRCASTAAGPAFEGARIAMGMRAATGAISAVNWEGGRLQCHVLGQAPARGICGSGLVDAAAVGLERGWILPTGRLRDGAPLVLQSPVYLSQSDIRELQLAKGAIAAGLQLLLRRWEASPTALATVHLAGAFGNYISLTSARRIGLLKSPLERVRPAGNTALLGAKLVLFSLPEARSICERIRRAAEHISLDADEQFQETFVEEMHFPGSV